MNKNIVIDDIYVYHIINVIVYLIFIFDVSIDAILCLL